MAAPLRACDVCGCANGGAYYGLMPQSNRAMVGVRYTHQSFVTHAESQYLRTSETFQSTELYGRFFPLKRVQVLASLPYRFDQQSTTSGLKKQQGWGDATVLMHYNVLNTFMDSEKNRRFNHSLLLGGGVKIPTGKFRYDESNPLVVANANFQPGTGSTDLILNAFYTLTFAQWGLSAVVSQKVNSTNDLGYKFGNQLAGNLDIFRTFTLGTATLMPHIGVYAEHARQSTEAEIRIQETGGHLVNATAGVSMFTNRWTAGLSLQKPMVQELSNGHVVSKGRGQVQIAWLF